MLEEHLGEPDRILHAHAPVREVALRAGEKLALGGVVHVDIVLVGEAELDDAERVLGAGRLHEAVVGQVGVRPVDAVGIDGVAVVGHAQAVGADHISAAAAEELVEEPAAALLQTRFQLLELDAVRHAPFGMEDDIQHVRREHRRRPCRLPDDDLFDVGLFVVLHDPRHVLGDVIPDVE